LKLKPEEITAMVWNLLKSSGNEKNGGPQHQLRMISPSTTSSLINLGLTTTTTATATSPAALAPSDTKLKSCLKVKSNEDLLSLRNDHSFDNQSHDHSTAGTRSVFSRGSNSSRSSTSKSSFSSGRPFRKSILSRQLQKQQASSSRDQSNTPSRRPVSPENSTQSADDSHSSSGTNSIQQQGQQEQQNQEHPTSDSVELSTASDSTRPAEKNVRFADIHIRDYERVVGDNPSCSSGPPVG
jgi:hypothetical protein